ncbi:MAG: helix-turn-helix transcriptional regulator [Ruminococcaceae bacterium]|nr:helix-turn-helix transcriptional regulator [Oscillospiraceae bacterium]
MTLGKRIAEHRQQMGFSQEKLAEIIGVSRQAVTKWEADQTLPSSSNLLKLAEVFGTTADMLLPTKTVSSPDKDDETITLTRRQLLALLEEDRRLLALRRRHTIQKNVLSALVVLLGYGFFYIMGRIIWCDLSDISFFGWLISVSPAGKHSYLYGWLLSSGMLWIALTVSVLPALFGKKAFSLTTLIGFWLGFGTGMLFGPNPEGDAYGFGHYGWAIWGTIFLLSIAVGIIAELLLSRKSTPKSPPATPSEL